MSRRYNIGLYLRLSLEDADNSSKVKGGNPFKSESASIENQRDILTEYVRLNGWNIVKEYTDDGFSGGSFDRPAFQSMISDAKAGLIDLILVKDLSRFGRDHIGVDGYVEDVFPSLGVRFIALMDGIDSEGGADILPFRSLMNDYYLKDLSRKIKSVIVEKAKAGNFIGRFAPYGYVKDSARHGRLLIEPYTAGIVRRIFNLRLDGYGYEKIAGVLNADGILSPKAYIYSKEGIKNPRGKEYFWRGSQIKRILQNEIYLGHSVRMKQGHTSYKNKNRVKHAESDWIRVDNTHEPIISQELWDLSKAVKRTPFAYENSMPTKDKLFAGLLECGNGHSMGGVTDNQRYNGELKKYNNYTCSLHRQSGRAVCSWHMISELTLLRIVKEDMAKQLTLIEVNESRVISGIQTRLTETSVAEIRNEHQRVSAKIKTLDERSAKLYEERLTGAITLDRFILLSKDLDVEMAELQAVHNRLSEALTDNDRQLADAEQWLSRVRAFLSMEEPDRATLRGIVKKIVIGERQGSKTGKERRQDIKIIYRFSQGITG